MSYAHPEVLVSTEWVQEHLNDPKVRIVEVDYDPLANYQLGHIPGAVLFDWRKDLNHPLQRDILSKEQLEQLFSKSGISNDTKIALYRDFNNWFAAYAYWDLQFYGVKNAVLINGGRKKWIDEDKPLTKDIPKHATTNFRASNPDENIRVYLRQALDLHNKPNVKFVDVRSPRIPHRTRAAWGPHTRRSQHTLEPSCQRRRHLQTIRGHQETLRSRRRNRRQGHRSLLPHRRTI